MNKPLFHATCVATISDEFGWTVGFADREYDTRHYLRLQRAHVDDEQDSALGLDTYYVEKDDQSNSCYGGIESIYLRRNSVRLTLNNKGSQSLELGKTVLITFDADKQALDNLRQGLVAIFSSAGIYSESIEE